MSNLYLMNIYLLYIFLIHFVANKERFFFKLKGFNDKKYEFALNLNTVGGKDFYNKLKTSKSFEFQLSPKPNYFELNNVNFKLMIDTSIAGASNTAYQPGEIIAKSNILRIARVVCDNEEYH